MVRRDFHQDESIDPDIKPYKEMFLGSICGVLLRQRGENDPHVSFELIGEDDEHWFEHTGGASSSWFSDYIEVITAAKKWCEENCDPDISERNNIQYGWKFKQ